LLLWKTFQQPQLPIRKPEMGHVHLVNVLPAVSFSAAATRSCKERRLVPGDLI
jgi:hypothetical protein